MSVPSPTMIEVEGHQVAVYPRRHSLVVLGLIHRNTEHARWMEVFRGDAAQVRAYLGRRLDHDFHRIYDVAANEVREVRDSDLPGIEATTA